MRRISIVFLLLAKALLLLVIKCVPGRAWSLRASSHCPSLIKDASVPRCEHASRSQRNQAARIKTRLHQSVSNNNSEETSELLARAAKLRKEVQELESRAGKRPSRPKSEEQLTKLTKPVEYTKIADSVWTISYRFSDEPEPSDEEAAESTQKQRRFFSGKATLNFKADGYTDLISQETTGSATAKIIKVWGWDLEAGSEDDNDLKGDSDKEYLVLSMDIDLPKSVDGEKSSMRFYFQARQEKDSKTNKISLSGGTVAIKRDVVKKSARWGLFSPAGILAQFRNVGNFVARETSV